ncbi:MAG: SUF system Fe-S cluster assembly protein [Acidobacteriota bacterium]
MKGETMDETSTPSAPLTAAEADTLDVEIVEALKTIYDPEIPVNIYELGLIYDVAINPENRHVDCKMTLTSPGCPVAGSLPGEVQAKIAGVPGVESADVELVWDPVWNPNMMTEEARLELGML